MQTYKYAKLELLRDYYYPNCTWNMIDFLNAGNDEGAVKRNAAADLYNRAGGPAYGQCITALGYFTHSIQMGPQNQIPTKDSNGNNKNELDENKTNNTAINCQIAESNITRDILPKFHEKIKAVGDNHYGKSWYY